MIFLPVQLENALIPLEELGFLPFQNLPQTIFSGAELFDVISRFALTDGGD